jgi:DNA-directed RNA polymerase subunit M/transcription elongation factor TFIIS
MIMNTKKPAQSLKDARNYAMTQLSKHVSPSVSKEMERSLMEYTKKECMNRKIQELRWSDVRVRRLYIRKLRMLLNNISPLIRVMDSHDVTAERSAFVSHQDLRPDIYDPILDVMERREKFSILNYAEEEEGYEGLLKCDNCGSKRTTYVTLQTRSADEPETIYLKCFSCGRNDTIRD